MNCLRFLLCLLCLASLPRLALPQDADLAALHSELANASTPEAQLTGCINVGQWHEVHYTDSSLHYARLAQRIARKLGTDDARARALFATGTAHEYSYNLDSAMYYYQLAKPLGPLVQLPIFYPQLLAHIGHVYTYRAQHEQALTAFLNSIQWMEQHTLDSGMLAANHTNIGGVYYELYLYDNALQHLNTAEAIYTALGISSGMADVLFYRAGIHSAEGRFEEALADFQQNQQLDVAEGNKQAIAYGYANIALHFLTKPDFDSAWHYLQLGRVHADSLGDPLITSTGARPWRNTIWMPMNFHRQWPRCKPSCTTAAYRWSTTTALS